MKYSLLAALIAQAFVSGRCAAAQSSPSCKDEKGNDVDWFIIYKLPHNTLQSFNPTGGKFVYVDDRISKNKPSYWPLSEQDLFDHKNPIAYTLQPLYENNPREDILYFLYNDQPPKPYQTNVDRSHSKGVVLFNETAGVWLLHTVPKFIKGRNRQHYEFPDTAKTKGQMFMCVTFKTAQINTIAKLLRTESANVYDHKTTNWIDRYPDVKELADNNFLEGDHTLKENLASISGHLLWAYAKPAAAGTDLYYGEIFDDLREPIVVHSWRNGPGRRIYTPDEVFDIAFMVLKYGEENSVQFAATVDHSKWAFTMKSDFFCFGSSNRKEPQEKRGGEALCFDNDVVKALFCSGVKAAHPRINCNNERKRPRFEPERGPA